MTISTSLSFAGDVLLRVTLVLGAFGVTGYLLRGQAAALRHLVWSLAIAGCVAVPVLTLVNPYTLPVLPARATGAPAASAIRESWTHTVAVTHTQTATTADDAQLAHADDIAPPAERAPIDWVKMLLVAWVGGTLAFLVRFIAGVVAIRRLVRDGADAPVQWTDRASAMASRFGVRRRIRVVLSHVAEMPFAFGVTNRVIVLPATAVDWVSERRDAVLMHELAHFSRGDITMNALSQIARALYWFHPLAWLASHRLRVEAERASDDVVLRGGARPSDYAEHLLAIVQSFGRPLPQPALAMARRSDFEGRLLAILEPRERRALSRTRTLAIGTLAFAVMLPLSAVSSTARAAAPAPRPEPLVAPPSAEQAETPLPPKRETAAPVTPARQDTPVKQDVPASSTLGALIGALTDANAEVRAAAVKSIASFGDPRAIAALAKALREDTDARVREAAAWALGEIDDARGVPPLLEALKTERVAAVRERIVHALGEIDDASAVSGIAAASRDVTASVRREVAWALGELEDPSAAPALVGMAKDDDVEVRRNVAQALKDLKSEGTFDALVTLAHDADAEVRSSAVNGLGELQDRRALPTLVDALKDSNPDVRSNAADAIKEIPDIRTAPRALIDALSDPNADVRHNAAHALGEIGDEAAVTALTKATSDSNADVKRAAAEALSDIGGVEATAALMALVKDPDPEIRKIAVEALGKRR